MADDLSSAPATGDSAPAPVDMPTPAASAPAEAATAKTQSVREALQKAAAKVSEQEQGAAVLRDGVGADEKALSDAEKANAASERARKSWDTRRANEKTASEKAAEEAKNKELGTTIANAVKEGQQAAQPQPAPATESKHSTAPTRFMKEAQAAWNNTPEEVRAETHRAINELEGGLAKYKEGSERWTELAEFDALARQHSTTIKQTLSNYVAADQLIARDPVKGIEHVLKSHGISLVDFAEHVLDREVGSQSSANDPVITGLRQQIDNLTKQLQDTQTQQRTSVRERIDAEVAAFQKAHPRVADPAFESEMAFFISSGKAKTLQEAYELAERLIPAPKGPNVANPDPADQTRKASLSLTGAPDAGSNPAVAGKRSRSIRDAVQRAAQQTGLG